MPMIIPLAAAAGSIAAGIAAGATTLIGGAMIAGGALTAIGVITKNEKLTRIGGLVSLAGGIAGLASGAWASAASSLADQSAMVASQEAFRAAELGSTAATNAAMGEMGSVAGVGGGAAPAGAAEAAGSAIGAGPSGQEIGRQALQAGLPQPPAPVQPNGANVIDVGAVSAPGGVRAPGGAPGVTSLGDTVNQVGGWMSRNKELVNTASGIIGGAMKNASEQDALAERWRKEEEAIRRRRAQLSQSIVGLQMPTYQPPTKG